MKCATVVEHFLSLCNSRGTIDRRPAHGTRMHATSMLQETLQTNCKPTQARIHTDTHTCLWTSVIKPLMKGKHIRGHTVGKKFLKTRFVTVAHMKSSMPGWSFLHKHLQGIISYDNIVTLVAAKKWSNHWMQHYFILIMELHVAPKLILTHSWNVPKGHFEDPRHWVILISPVSGRLKSLNSRENSILD